MWNVTHMFNIPYGVYSNRTFNKKQQNNFYSVNGETFL